MTQLTDKRFRELVLRQTGTDKLFSADAPIVIARAPGRLDVMGGIADYSGSLVLEMPITERTFAAVQVASDDILHLVSDVANRDAFTISLSALQTDAPHSHFPKGSDYHWASYIVGVFWVLMQRQDIVFVHGARVFIESDVPEGKGVSSSAALEVAVMRAVIEAFQLNVAEDEIPALCQQAENLVAGAPCGIMDQMTVVHGKPSHLLALCCKPATIKGYIAVPDDLAIWGIDSGIRHAVSGSDYGAVRVGAFMGLKMIEARTDFKLNGYLTNLSTSEFDSVADVLPKSIRGADFLEQFGPLPDTVTSVDPNASYAVLQPTTHPIYENWRVTLFASRFVKGAAYGRLLGALMKQSHDSYSACGLGSTGTDLLVNLVRQSGRDSRLFGAKITGGGSGGTVAVLGRADAEAEIGRIAAQYAEQTGHTPYIFRTVQGELNDGR